LILFRCLYPHPVDKPARAGFNQSVLLRGYYSKKDYPERLRYVRFSYNERNEHLVFLTNSFSLPAITIVQLYRCRWKIELFFKRINQHLWIKAFYGTSENAVKTQIAISVYVLVAIVKKRLSIKQSLYIIQQILSITLFEKTLLLQSLSISLYEKPDADNTNQLTLHE